MDRGFPIELDFNQIMFGVRFDLGWYLVLLKHDNEESQHYYLVGLLKKSLDYRAI